MKQKKEIKTQDTMLILSMFKTIVKECVETAGESYEEFGRNVTKELVKSGFVEYGE